MDIKPIIHALNRCIENQYDTDASFFSKVSSENEADRINSLRELKDVLIFGKFYNENESCFDNPNAHSYPEVKKEVREHLFCILGQSDRIAVIPGLWTKLAIGIINRIYGDSLVSFLTTLFSEASFKAFDVLFNSKHFPFLLGIHAQMLPHINLYQEIISKDILFHEGIAYKTLQVRFILWHIVKQAERGLPKDYAERMVDIVVYLSAQFQRGIVNERSFERLFSTQGQFYDLDYFEVRLAWLKYFDRKWDALTIPALVNGILEPSNKQILKKQPGEDAMLNRFLNYWFSLAEYYPNLLNQDAGFFLQTLDLLLERPVVDADRIEHLDAGIDMERHPERIFQAIPGLWVTYENPLWFSKHFFDLSSQAKQSFFSLASGIGLHRLEGIELRISSRESHILATMPERFVPRVYWHHWLPLGVLASRLILRGASERLMQRMSYHYRWISYLVTGEERLDELCGFLLRNEQQLIASNELDQTFEYISSRYRMELEYSLKGRSFRNLVEAAREWHRYRNNPSMTRRWEKVSVHDYDTVQNGNLYIIRQLNTYEELYEEGRNLRHCVAGYSSWCSTGRCAIFSLRKKEDGQTKPLVTLELRNNIVVQARGFGNRRITGQEAQILEMWAKREGLGMVV